MQHKPGQRDPRKTFLDGEYTLQTLCFQEPRARSLRCTGLQWWRCTGVWRSQHSRFFFPFFGHRSFVTDSRQIRCSLDVHVTPLVALIRRPKKKETRRRISSDDHGDNRQLSACCRLACLGMSSIASWRQQGTALVPLEIVGLRRKCAMLTRTARQSKRDAWREETVEEKVLGKSLSGRGRLHGSYGSHRENCGTPPPCASYQEAHGRIVGAQFSVTCKCP